MKWADDVAIPAIFPLTLGSPLPISLTRGRDRDDRYSWDGLKDLCH